MARSSKTSHKGSSRIERIVRDVKQNLAAEPSREPEHAVVMSMRHLKLSRGLKWGSGVFAAVAMFFAVAAWFYLPLGPFIDDGPFHGKPTAPVIYRAPDQSINLWNGNVLEVYDSTSKGTSAIVQFRRADNSVQWTIFADGHDSGDVRSIRFSNVHRGMARSGMVTGTVDWTYGHEATYWFITGSGELRDYWYSW